MTRWVQTARAALLMVGCGAMAHGCAPPAAEDEKIPCPVDRGDFAFRPLAGGPIQRPTPPEPELAPGQDHHPHTHAQDTAAPWRPGLDVVGPLALSWRAADGSDRSAIIADGWRPARSLTQPAWRPPPSAPSADTETLAWLRAAKDPAALVDPARGLFFWDPDSDEPKGRHLRGEALSSVGRSLRAVLAELTRCADALCVGPSERALGVVATRGRVLTGVYLGWTGSPEQLEAFRVAAEAPWVGPQRAILGELLSIEEGGRLEVVATRLEALRAADPEDPMLLYLLARNAAGRGEAREALEGLSRLAARTDAASLAARSLTELHEEWEPLRRSAAYQQIQAELFGRIPANRSDLLAYLLRFRRSMLHLRAAIRPEGPPWTEVSQALTLAALLSPLLTEEAIAITTPTGTLRIELGLDTDGIPFIRGLDGPEGLYRGGPSPL